MVAGSDDGAGDLKVVAGADEDDIADDPCRMVLAPAFNAADPLPGSHNWTPSPIQDGESTLPQPPPAATEAWVVMEETMSRAAERFQSHFSLTPTRIHRFPHYLRGIGGTDGRYVVPSMVAIGPYHRGWPHLQETEELKRVAARSFCRGSGRSVQEVYEKVFSVTGDARGCYAATDGSSPVAHLSDTEFADMMFLDGCFLLEIMEKHNEPPFAGLAMSCGPSILKDIFLLENQIPWLVLEVLMQFRPMSSWSYLRGGVWYFLKGEETKLQPWIMRSLHNLLTKCLKEKTINNTTKESSTDSYRPPHLLGLLRSTLIQSMPPEKQKSIWQCSRSMSSSAVDLAQIGFMLTSSKVRWFADVNVRKKPFLFGELSLSPLFLNDVVACYLVNMAALEAAEANTASSFDSDGYVVSSYLSVLAMLMDREEDVHELRARGVLCSHFSNTQTLAFFKGLGQHLRLGYNYFSVVQEIEDYMRKRPARIVVHKFVYNNYRVIFAVMSIASVLVGIFKALYALKKP
ncbi:hypothetical protein ACP4OV_018572 [Aristida adscensionis]